MARQITAPLTKEAAASRRAGESVLLSGAVYTARDAAHKRLCALAAEGKPLPFPIQGAVIYFVGPTPARPGQAIGSAGPTTSYRMDAYSPTLLRLGQLGMIGKGRRGPEVIQAMKETGAVYFGAIGGAAGASSPPSWCATRIWGPRPSGSWRWRTSPSPWSSTARATTSTRPAGPPIWPGGTRKRKGNPPCREGRGDCCLFYQVCLRPFRGTR